MKDKEEGPKKKLRRGPYELPGVGVKEDKGENLRKADQTKEKKKEERVGRNAYRALPEEEERVRKGRETEEGGSGEEKRKQDAKFESLRQGWEKTLKFVKRMVLNGRSSRKRQKQEIQREERLGGLELPKRSLSGEAATSSLFSPRACDSSTELGHESKTSLGLGQAVDGKNGALESSEWGSLGFIINWLSRVADDFNIPLCKAVPKGRLFPLPSSPSLLAKLFPNSTHVCRLALGVLVKSLNSLNGEGDKTEEIASEYQCKVLRRLMTDCERVAAWKFDAAPQDWDQFFLTRSVDYKGDEILTAQSMRWENVSPALPAEVGGVLLEDVVELGCKHYVLNFEDYILDPKDQVYCKAPRVMVPPDGWYDFCSNLLRIGVFDMIHEDDVYKVEDQLLLNGLFGVSKHEFQDGWEILRIIMNLIPLNGVCREFQGDVGTLPAWSGMTALQLHPHEGLVVSSEDVRCFSIFLKCPKVGTSSLHSTVLFQRNWGVTKQDITIPAVLFYPWDLKILFQWHNTCTVLSSRIAWHGFLV